MSMNDTIGTGIRDSLILDQRIPDPDAVALSAADGAVTLRAKLAASPSAKRPSATPARSRASTRYSMSSRSACSAPPAARTQTSAASHSRFSCGTPRCRRPGRRQCSQPLGHAQRRGDLPIRERRRVRRRGRSDRSRRRHQLNQSCHTLAELGLAWAQNRPRQPRPDKRKVFPCH
jgi:hypothetical protein